MSEKKFMLQGVIEKVGICREHAMLGDYSSAREYFEAILSQIDSYVAKITSSGVEKQWNRVRKNLRTERSLLVQLEEETKLSNFRKGEIRGGNGNGGGEDHLQAKFDDLVSMKRKNPRGSGSGGAAGAAGQNRKRSKLEIMRDRRLREKDSSGKDDEKEGNKYGNYPFKKKYNRPWKVSKKKRKKGKGKKSGKSRDSKDKKKGDKDDKKKGDKDDKKKGDKDDKKEEEGEKEKKFDAGPLLQPLVDIINKDVIDDNYSVTWDDVAGLSDAKKLLHEAAILPLWIPNFFQGLRSPWRGVLMFGPPGTGKTMLAKAVATMAKTCFFNVSLASITSKWRGESEKLIRVLFEMARFHAPSTIFIDEIDALCSKRGSGHEHETSRRVKTELLVQMDGIHSTEKKKPKENNKDEKGEEEGEEKDKEEGEERKIVLVLGATNHPWDLDEALRRRLEKRIYIPLPDFAGRVQLFKLFCKTVSLSDDVNYDLLAKLSAGYSAADIKIVCRDAAMMSVRKELSSLKGVMLREEVIKKQKEFINQPICKKDFASALKKISPSVNDNDLKKFKDWMDQFGSV